jgi:hypothetical protein
MFRRTILAVLVAVVFSGLVAVAQSVPSDLTAAIGARQAALATGDEQAWARYTTDDFRVINVDGVVATKAERLAVIKGRKAPPPTPVEETVRTYGDAAIRTVRAQNWVTEVWVKQNGQWRVAAVSFSPIAKK